MQPRFNVPQKTEIIVDKAGFQLQRLFKFFDELSKGSWSKSYPNINGSVTNYAITSSPALVSLKLASLTPYQRDDQTWLLDLNIIYTVASGSRTGLTMSISNVEFLDTSDIKQAVTGFAIDGSAAVVNCYSNPGTGDIIIEHATGTTTTYSFNAKGIILDSKPSFAE